jgi:hypothetical protein
MKRLIPACAFALAAAVTAQAQDQTVTTKSRVEADDARTLVATGCLEQTLDTKAFSLVDAVGVTGDELSTKTRVSTDVDDNEASVKTESRARVDGDERPVGTSGTMKNYALSPRAGVDLTPHVGKRVEISGIMVPAAKGDKDAEVSIREETKVDGDHGADGKVKTRVEADIQRGAHPQLNVLSVKAVPGDCSR